MIRHRLAATAVLSAAALTSAAAAQPPCQPYWQFAHTQPRTTWSRMTAFDDGSGPALYLQTPSPSRTIMRLRANGAWEVVEEGLASSTSVFPPMILDDGNGPGLFVLGATQFPTWDYWVARWDGARWNRVYPGMYSGGQWSKVPVVSVDVGDGMTIYGIESRPGWVFAVLRWNGTEWVEFAVVDGHPSLYAFDLGDGPGLYAIGNFNTIGGVQSRGFARWTGSTWIDLSHPDYSVSAGSRSTVVYDDGSGRAIYTLNAIYHLGEFLGAVKRWRNGIWEEVGTPVLPPNTVTAVHDLHTFDDGTGPALYVIGGFPNINGVPANQIARYDASGWSAVGPGFLRPYRLGSLKMDAGPSLVVAQQGIPAYIGQRVGCPSCYANCDQSVVPPRLNVDDFTCFINQFAHAYTMPAMHQPYHYANCDASTTAPVLDVSDFMCFINRFVGGCD